MSEQDLQAEIQRLQCLQALGITVYHPRFRLPGARPSLPGPWVRDTPQQDANQALARQPTEARPANPKPPRASIDIDVQPAGPAQPSANAAPATAALHTGNEATGTVANFQLLFLQVDVELALVNQLPALARPQLQDRQLALLSNLLRWLGKSVPVEAPRVFRWPLPGLEQMAAGMSAATSLLHFLEQACTERRFRYLLQLGPQAVAAPSSDWQAFATHSLDEMLALPGLKRDAWQALLPLHALLQAKG